MFARICSWRGSCGPNGLGSGFEQRIAQQLRDGSKGMRRRSVEGMLTGVIVGEVRLASTVTLAVELVDVGECGLRVR